MLTISVPRPVGCLALLSLLLVVASPTRGAEPAFGKKPNILFIITDDQGYGDLRCHGNPVVQTPNIDRLHGESRRFTDYNVSPTCAPTRCSLLSGRHEFRSGVTHTINERERMALGVTTYAQVLKSVGYATAIFGKWHLGDEDAYQPGKRGFDEVFIHGAGGIGQGYTGSCGDAPNNNYFNPAILHNGSFVRTKGYCTDVFFEQATQWIAGQRGKGPFYAHIATNAPHAPLNCPEEYVRKYEGKVDAQAAKFFGMVTNIDDNVGRLLARLKEWDLEQNTLVIFTTDNGGTAGVRTFNAGMRGAKGTPYRGGTRVPSFWRWPGVLSPGDVDRLVAHVDVFPTFAELSGAALPQGQALDGRSLVPLLKDAAASWGPRHLITHVGRWERGRAAESKYRDCSIRDARHTLVMHGRAASGWELYDLQADPGQKTDLAAKEPAVVRTLASAYDEWWESVLPGMVNEDALIEPINPFKERYWRQFGGGVDWPARVRKPYEKLPPGPDLGLRPLLVKPEAWEAERSRLHAEWSARLGAEPPRPGRLDVHEWQSESLDGYTRRLLSFHSEGGDRVRAYLLVPKNLRPNEKRPAVVVFHPTTRDTLREPVGLGAKPEERAQGLHLVRRGYIVLCPECYILKDPVGWAKGQAEALARRRPGWTGLGKMTFDASRCLDFLETLPEVDERRIGCLGFSLGAKEVLFAMAFEPRYRVGVFNEGGIGLRMSNWTDSWYLTERMKPHIPALENHQVLALVAPRPFLILGGDSADGDASWPFVEAARPAYERYGAGDRMGLFNHRGKHTYPKEGRRVSYQWLDYWLQFTPTTDEVGGTD